MMPIFPPRQARQCLVSEARDESIKARASRKTARTAIFRDYRLFGACLALLPLMVLSGCASAPPPDGIMDVAQAQLKDARSAGAADYAPVEMNNAWARLQQAQQAMAQHQYDKAFQWATEASADAELADTKARLNVARARIQAMTEQNARLRQQMLQPQSLDETPQDGIEQGFQPVAPGDIPTAASSAVSADRSMPAPAASALRAPTAQGFQPVPQGTQQGDTP